MSTSYHQRKAEAKAKSVTTNGISVHLLLPVTLQTEKEKNCHSGREWRFLVYFSLSLSFSLSVCFSFLWPFFLSPFAIMQLVARLTSLFFSLRSLSYLFFCHFFFPSSLCLRLSRRLPSGRASEHVFKKKAKSKREREEQKKVNRGQRSRVTYNVPKNTCIYSHCNL